MDKTCKNNIRFLLTLYGIEEFEELDELMLDIECEVNNYIRRKRNSSIQRKKIELELRKLEEYRSLKN
jgi:hypothetical protein